jgi:3-deoxy-D-manno-octulosonic acid kinase
MFYFHFNDELVPAAQHDFIQQALNGKFNADSDRLLGVSHGRGTTYFLKTTPELAVDSVLRHYRRGGLFGKLVKDCYLFTGLSQTRAYAEFSLLQQLHAWGLPVPRPVAIKVEKNLLTYRADMLLEKLNNAADLSQLLQHQTLPAAQYRAIGKLIRQLHNHQVCHTDLNIHNIMQDDQGKFWLIDFDKCAVKKGEEWKVENLARLLRSFHKEQQRLHIQFCEADWQHLTAGYQAG